MEALTRNKAPPIGDVLSPKKWGLHRYAEFDMEDSLKMMGETWPIIISIVAGYLTMVFFVKPIRHPFWDLLRTVRQTWNAGLAIFSLLGSAHTVPPVLYLVVKHGFVSAVTDLYPTILIQGPTGFWLLLFVLGKIAELGDTVLLLFSGRKPSFLHWYHHATVLPWCWYELHAKNPMHFVCMTINYTVHAVMYAYFALNDLFDEPGFRRRWGKRITFIQCSQFFLDLVTIFVVACKRIYTGPGNTSVLSLILSSTIISSYLVLFLQFAEQKYGFYSQFCHALYRSRNKKKEEKDCVMPWHRTDLSLEQRFEEAAKMAVMLSYVANKEDLMGLYGAYKLVKSGPMPPLLKKPEGDEKEIAKWDAWNQASSLTKDEAMTSYVALMDVLSARSKAAQAKSSKRSNKLQISTELQASDPFTMYPVKIVGHGAYHPNRVVLNEEIEAMGGFALSSQDKKRTGVVERRFVDVDGGENLVQNGAKAIRRACASAGVAVEDLDLIVGGFGGHQLIPDDAIMVHRELGLGESGIRAFTVHATCLSFFVATEVAASFIRDGRYRNVAVFASSVASTGLNFKDPHTAGLFGDGAAAIILQPTDGASSIHRVAMESFGIGSEVCCIRSAGFFRPPRSPYFDRSMECFEMDGPGTLSLISKFVRGSLARYMPGLERGLENLQVPGCDKVVDIDWVIPHQASAVGLDAMSMFGWQKDKLLRTIHKYGNTIAASIPLTLCDYIDNGTIKRGDTILLCGTSAGLSFGAMLLTY